MSGEWLYLCVYGNYGAMEVLRFVHFTTSTINRTSRFPFRKHCCLIDYILHSVDSAIALLNSPPKILLGMTQPSFSDFSLHTT